MTPQSPLSLAGDSPYASAIQGVLCIFIHRTKTVVTPGPASNSLEVLGQLILTGVDVARFNFSYDTPDEHRAHARLMHELTTRRGRLVALLDDPQGPKIHIAKFTNKCIELQIGDKPHFFISHVRNVGTQEAVGTDCPDLVEDCGAGDESLPDDGWVVMVVEEAAADELRCRVLVGDLPSDHKGTNRRDGGLTAPALTGKDKADIRPTVDIGLNYVAISFPRDAKDMEYARRPLTEAGGKAWLVARIGRVEAVADNDTLDGLIRVGDAVTVARGDLGVEAGDAELVGIQKKTILHARHNNKAVITVTQTMELMIHNLMLIRVEVSDVTSAVSDYIGAMAFSTESAAGECPVETVKVVTRVCQSAEKHLTSQKSSHRLDQTPDRHNESIALMSIYTANYFPGIKAVVCLTENDFIPLTMLCTCSSVPIYAHSPHHETQAYAAIFRGVETTPFNSAVLSVEKVSQTAIGELLKRGVVTKGDWVILTRGGSHTVQGGINTMKVLHVGDLLIQAHVAADNVRGVIHLMDWYSANSMWHRANNRYMVIRRFSRIAVSNTRSVTCPMDRRSTGPTVARLGEPGETRLAPVHEGAERLDHLG